MGGYKFPETFPLKLKLKDMLDTNVDIKYNLSDIILRNITFNRKESPSGIIEVANLNSSFCQINPIISTEGICSTLLARDYKQPKQIIDERYYLSDKGVTYVTNEYRLSHKITQIDGDIALCLTARGNTNLTGTFISELDKEEK